MSIDKISDLLKRQEVERQDLAVGAYSAWLHVQEKEVQLLSSVDSVYEKAPLNIQDDIDKAREEYFEEWGSDGKLGMLMTARHIKERQKLAEQQRLTERLQYLKTKSGHEHGR